MANLYQVLCVVRTSLLNAVSTKYIEGGAPLIITSILDDIVAELEGHVNFMEELFYLNDTELLDLGFEYINGDSDLMLFPVWLYPFIPDGAVLRTSNGEEFIMGIDTVSIHGDHWVSVGFNR